MNLRSPFWLIAALLSLAVTTTVAGAKTVEVKVGPNGTLTFSPKTVVIDAGDSVKFTNQGGSHNVAASSGAWTCAQGCSDSGGNGNISSAAWSFTRTFNTPGTIGYYCQAHGTPNGGGMAGSIVVNDVAPPPPEQKIVAGISGNWFNPTANQGGHGFQLEVLPGNAMLAIWFVFNPAGTAQNWIYSQGPYDPNSNDVVLPAFLEQGGAFPPNFDSTQLTVPEWGALEFRFTDCNNGTAEYTPNEPAVNAGYGHVTFPIKRVTSISGVACP
jgi:plastocyanin